MSVLFVVYWNIPHRYRWIALFAGNIYFYTCYSVKYLVVLLITTVFSYLMALKLEEQALKGRPSRGLFIVSVTVPLGLLFIFKYLNFTIYSVEKVLSIIKIPVSQTALNIIMPVGISFYSFEMVSYLCDVYRGKIKAERNIFKYIIFVSFFANISSGPIERAGHFIPQIDKEKSFDYKDAVYGTRLLLLGLFKKIVFADMLAKYVNAVYDHVPEMTGICFLIGAFLYTFQIYLDFSGYSDMAIGLARMLGFELTVNFRSPYLASSIREFWSRWHISLSTWFRDYLYIPLGGNRCSRLKRDRNLLITFLVSGLWHGASFTFILWGGIHGICQIIENRIRDYRRKKDPGALDEKGVKKVLKILLTFAIVSFAWLFFRANSISEAYRAVRYMFDDLSLKNAMIRMTMSYRSVIKILIAIVSVILLDVYSMKKDVLIEFDRLKAPLRWIVYFGMGILILTMAANNGDVQEFIYFKF